MSTVERIKPKILPPLKHGQQMMGFVKQEELQPLQQRQLAKS